MSGNKNMIGVEVAVVRLAAPARRALRAPGARPHPRLDRARSMSLTGPTAASIKARVATWSLAACFLWSTVATTLLRTSRRRLFMSKRAWKTRPGAGVDLCGLLWRSHHWNACACCGSGQPTLLGTLRKALRPVRISHGCSQPCLVGPAKGLADQTMLVDELAALPDGGGGTCPQVQVNSG